jgi:hypothetical protein
VLRRRRCFGRWCSGRNGGLRKSIAIQWGGITMLASTGQDRRIHGTAEVRWKLWWWSWRKGATIGAGGGGRGGGRAGRGAAAEVDVWAFSSSKASRH